MRVATAAAARYTADQPTALPHDHFGRRHIGPQAGAEVSEMLKAVGAPSLEEFMNQVVPKGIRRTTPLNIPAMTEPEVLAHLRQLMSKNQRHYKSLLGQGYYESVLPPVIQRNVLENPQWYTPYTPYQAEISQGRLESLLNYQTVVMELTGMPLANASLLDEATAAVEAVVAASHLHKRAKRKKVLVDSKCFATTIEMVQGRCAPMGIDVVVTDVTVENAASENIAAILVQTPDAEGRVRDFTDLFSKAKAKSVTCLCATDLLSCAIMKPPGEMGADIVFGNAQRFGVPLGYGGPHPAFFAVTEPLKRLFPGRIIGVSKDTEGDRTLRMALQTREQHIKREYATSNICTAQALLANIVAMFACFHGPDGLKAIATRVHGFAQQFALGAALAGHTVVDEHFFDTVTIELAAPRTADSYVAACEARKVNVWRVSDKRVSVAFDEAVSKKHLQVLLEAAGMELPDLDELAALAAKRETPVIPANLVRTSKFLQHPVFLDNHDETSLMRYIHKLARKDFGLQTGMIPLGSCTMKLNPAATMIPLSWPSIGGLHPYVPPQQAEGYQSMILALQQYLKEVSGFDAVSLQPNSGSQGEYAGLRAILAYHESRGDAGRNICLIPSNAHGTNPATAAIAGMKTLTVKCRGDGAIDLEHLKAMCEKHGKQVAAIMITYPSTYGIFDENIQTATKIVHDTGAQVYIDGANFNAMVGYTGPGFFGGDVCHFNLHKTFSIPHGGGGPGMGPIGVKSHLAPFLPGNVHFPNAGGAKSPSSVSQAPYGSASILTISYTMMTLLGTEGLTRCTAYAVLAANYLKDNLKNDYTILYTGPNGRVAHEFIIDCRPFKATSGVEAEDVAKRLIDYGFHPPTLAFPVIGTLMIEPTESEPKKELDRLIAALKSIRQEIRDIENGKWPKDNNPLHNAPHPLKRVMADEWPYPYTRKVAGTPAAGQDANKFWPSVGRVNQEFGDQNLFCSCAPPPPPREV